MLGIIYNPHSRRGTTRDRMEAFLKILDSRGAEYVYRVSEFPGASVDIAKELSETCDTLVIAGGDGSVHEVVQGSLGKDVSYVILPYGTGNDVALSSGISAEMSDEEMADIALGDRTREMDCFRVNGDVCVQFAAFGLVANIIEMVENAEVVNDSLYKRSIRTCILHNKTKRYTLICGDTVRTIDGDHVSIQNVKSAGGGVVVSHRTKDDDGYLDLVAVEHRGLIRYLKNVLAFKNGKLADQPNVIAENVRSATVRTETEEICCIDGEIVKLSEFSVEMCPERIRIKY